MSYYNQPGGYQQPYPGQAPPKDTDNSLNFNNNNHHHLCIINSIHHRAVTRLKGMVRHRQTSTLRKVNMARHRHKVNMVLLHLKVIVLLLPKDMVLLLPLKDMDLLLANMGHYASPPPQGQWGAPPPQQGQFGAPPGQYSVQPPQAGFGGPPTQPSLGYGPQQTANINVLNDVEAIRKAMKGFGTDEKALIAILSKKDPMQINTIRTQYDQRFMRSMVVDLEKETSGWFARGLAEISRGPLVSDCYNLMNAMKGLGTKESILDDILIGRSNADLNAIKQKYQELFKRSLQQDLKGDLSAGTEQMYDMIIAARRAEDSHPVIPQEIEQAVTDLQAGMGGFVGKNVPQVCQILTSKNDAQLRAMAHSYQQRFHKSLDAILKSSFSGHMQDALRLLVHRATNRAEAEAVRLEESMAGLGTKDELLVQRVVRCHWDRNFMGAVSQAYQQIYKKDLVKRIEGETRGDYERLLVACVRP
ncbi:hypothetical protein PTNB73_04004 [Pyrenophora teres f. teres]|nr:hypothetical protein PTNB73_04004 [Pyrenophora teres f. teres]